MGDSGDFRNEVQQNIKNLAEAPDLKELTNVWIQTVGKYKYTYNFSWLGRPIIQFPQDIMAMQEIIWNIRPDLIIETGIAHGGSIIFYASLLELLGNGMVVGIDIDIREHNRAAIEQHPFYRRIKMIEGSSTDENVIQQINELASDQKKIMVILDSNHTHEHVLKELEAYSPLVSLNSYLVVFDTLVEDLPDELFTDRPWGKGNNPKTAVWEFLRNNDQFKIDKEIESKLVITVAPDGFLKRVK